MKKILFIIPFLPYPLESGGHQALFNGIVAVKDDFDIYMAFSAEDNDYYRKAVSDFKIKVPSAHLFPLLHSPQSPVPRWRCFVYHLKCLIKKLLGIEVIAAEPNMEERMGAGWIDTIKPLSFEWTEHIKGICSSYQFDAIQVEMPWLVSQILSLPKDTKRIFVHHEIGFVRRDLEARGRNNSYIQACKTFADYNEIALLNMYDLIVTLSPDDSKKLKEHGVLTPVESSLAVVNSNPEITIQPISGNHLVFIGPDAHKPNRIGITWFLENCWSMLTKMDPNYKLDIIGRWNEQRIKEYKEKYHNVEFLGYVDDLKSALKDTVMIVPITIGSGIRMKILEAASNGVPFISTSVGAEGIPVKNGIHCVLADNPNEFVDGILKLRDQELQKRFILNASNLIKERYSLKALRQNRIGIYNQLLS